MLFNMILKRKALAKAKRRTKAREKAIKVEVDSNNNDNAQRRNNRHNDKIQVLPVIKATTARAKIRAKREAKEQKARPAKVIRAPPPILVLHHEANRRPVEKINLLVTNI